MYLDKTGDEQWRRKDALLGHPLEMQSDHPARKHFNFVFIFFSIFFLFCFTFSALKYLFLDLSVLNRHSISHLHKSE